MKKYFATYLAPAAVIAEWRMSTDETKKKEGMDAWKKWMKGNEKMFADMGSPLGKTKKVTKDGVSDSKNELTGYSIVMAESPEDAAKMFADHPHLMIPGSSIEIMEVIPMDSM